MAISPDFNVMLPNAEWSSWSASVCKAVKTYLWLIDKTTEEYEEEGIWYGKVLGGTAINFNFIAKDIGVDWATVRRHINMLVKAGKIRREREDVYEAYSYEVVGSFKFANKRNDDGTVTAPNGKKGTAKNPDTEERWANFLTSIGESFKKAINPEEKAIWQMKLEKAEEDYDLWCLAQRADDKEPKLEPESEEQSAPNLEAWESTVRYWNSDAQGHSAEEIRQAIKHVLDNPKQREYYAPIFQRDLKSLTRKGFVDKLVSDGKPSGKKTDITAPTKKQTQTESPNTSDYETSGLFAGGRKKQNGEEKTPFDCTYCIYVFPTMEAKKAHEAKCPCR